MNMKIKILNLNWRNRNEKTKWEDRLMEKINYAVMINFSASSKRRIVEIISQEIQKAVEDRDKEWNDKVCNLMGWEKNENYDRALLDLLEKQK